MKIFFVTRSSGNKSIIFLGLKFIDVKDNEPDVSTDVWFNLFQFNPFDSLQLSLLDESLDFWQNFLYDL